jgi:O-glycosyl hydrolase
LRLGAEAAVNVGRPNRILVAMLCFAVAKLHTGQSSVPDKDSVRVEVVESSEQLRESLQEKPPLQFGSNRAPVLTIDVNDSLRYQQIDGFGASLTDSSAWLISEKLSEAQRRELLEMLFDPKLLGWGVCNRWRLAIRMARLF